MESVLINALVITTAGTLTSTATTTATTSIKTRLPPKPTFLLQDVTTSPVGYAYKVSNSISLGGTEDSAGYFSLPRQESL
jgi:hypothetical protein